MINRVMNHIVIGRMGSASKVIIFKEENEFKKELAPPNAKIKHVEINNEKFVRMTYTYS